MAEAWRRVYYLPIAMLASGSAVAAFLAKQSGEPLAESVRHAGKRVGEHPEQGDTAFVFAAILAAVCVALYMWQRFGIALRGRFGLADARLPFSDDVVLYVLAVPVAVLSIWFMMVAGHSGATLVWKTNR